MSVKGATGGGGGGGGGVPETATKPVIVVMLTSWLGCKKAADTYLNQF